MDKRFKGPLVEYLRAELPRRFPEFSFRKLKPEERAAFGVAPLAVFATECGSNTYFISFIAHGTGSTTRFYVECGWKCGVAYPKFHAGSSDALRRIRDGTFDFSEREISMRLSGSVRIAVLRKPCGTFFSRKCGTRNARRTRHFAREPRSLLQTKRLPCIRRADRRRSTCGDRSSW